MAGPPRNFDPNLAAVAGSSRAVVNGFHPDVVNPATVVRVWEFLPGIFLEESLHRDLEWVHARRPDGASERETVRISEEAARRFEAIQAARYRNDLPPGGRFGYAAIGRPGSRDDVPGLVRWWTGKHGFRREEDFHPRDSRWRAGSTRSHIDAGSFFSDADATEISEREAERLQDALVERYRPYFEKEARGYEYFAITGEGRPLDDPLTVLRVWAPGKGEPVEERYSEKLGWEPSDLRHRVAGDQVVPIDETRLYNFTVLQFQRERRKNRP